MPFLYIVFVILLMSIEKEKIDLKKPTYKNKFLCKTRLDKMIQSIVGAIILCILTLIFMFLLLNILIATDQVEDTSFSDFYGNYIYILLVVIVLPFIYYLISYSVCRYTNGEDV